MATQLISRRKAISAVLAAGFAGAFRSVAGGGQGRSVLDKLNLAFIGIGNYGAVNLAELESQNCVAICDVDWRDRPQIPGRGAIPAEVAKNYSRARRFDDWRVMLEQMEKSIDAVVVCTADHTHAVAALTAMKMGKHVYCEKPLAHSVHDVRAMMDAAQRHNRQATQTGICGHASEDVRSIVEWVRDGAIGRVETVEVFQSRAQFLQRYTSIYDQVVHVDDDISAPPEVKWDLWLGPAPARRYNSMYLPLRWRNWRDFGTGILGDHGPHFLDPVVWALDLGYPESIDAQTDAEYMGRIAEQMYPAMSRVHYRFPARGGRGAVSLTWYGYDTPPVPDGWDQTRSFPNGGGILHGSKGKIVYGPVYSSKPFQPKQVWLLPAELDQDYKRPDKSLPRPSSHWNEWVDCANNHTRPSANWEYGGLLTELCLLGNIAIQFHGTRLEFDPVGKKFTHHQEANAMFQHPHREGWALPA